MRAPSFRLLRRRASQRRVGLGEERRIGGGERVDEVRAVLCGVRRAREVGEQLIGNAAAGAGRLKIAVFAEAAASKSVRFLEKSLDVAR